jgi:hypothetical protein
MWLGECSVWYEHLDKPGRGDGLSRVLFFEVILKRRGHMMMGRFRSGKAAIVIAVGVVVFFGVVIALVIFRSRHEHSRWLESVYENAVRKNQLVYTMRINLLASAEAEKSSVMADTDETSKAFAEQAMRASESVEEARLELGRLLEARNTPQEMKIFGEFSSCWSSYREVDREILPLAVQNTNLKALRLSFVPALDAVNRMEAGLNRLMDNNASSAEATGITRLSHQALTGALKVYILEAPHIAASADTRMDEIEARMKTLDEQVLDTLTRLQALVDQASRPFVNEARAAYLDFRNANAEIIELSRRNSNIRSFAVSLGQKRKVTAQCQENLAALQDAVQSTEFKATR